MALAKLKINLIVLIILQIPIIVNNVMIYIILIHNQELAYKELSKIAKLIALMIYVPNANQVLILIT